MHIEIAKREVEVPLKYAILCVLLLLIGTLLLSILGDYLALLSDFGPSCSNKGCSPPPTFQESIGLATHDLISGFFTFATLTLLLLNLSAINHLSQLIIAVLIFFSVGIARNKWDATGCRIGAAGLFAVYFGFIFILAILAALFPSVSKGIDSSDLPVVLSLIATSAFSSVIVYLWMLVMLKPDRKMVMKSTILSVIFVIAIYVLSAAILKEFGANPMALIINEFLFSFPLFYHASGKKHDEALYLFAIFYFIYALPFIPVVAYLNQGVFFQSADHMEELVILTLLILLTRALTPRNQ
jgi:hypothetical protein